MVSKESFKRKNIIGLAKFFGIDFIPKSMVISQPQEDLWMKMKTEAENCKLCPLSENRTNVVFGDGPNSAKVMFIGEAPGQDEDIQGLPFVGRAGKLLDQILQEINWDRKNIYITNIVKCRPPENRSPLPHEISRCNKYLKFQIEYIKPCIIVLLGAVSVQTILGLHIPNIKSIKEIRGNIYEFNGIKYLPTYHPAYILRNQKDYLLLKEDLIKAKRTLSEISKTGY